MPCPKSQDALKSIVIGCAGRIELENVTEIGKSAVLVDVGYEMEIGLLPNGLPWIPEGAAIGGRKSRKGFKLIWS